MQVLTKGKTGYEFSGRMFANLQQNQKLKNSLQLLKKYNWGIVFGDCNENLF